MHTDIIAGNINIRQYKCKKKKIVNCWPRVIHILLVPNYILTNKWKASDRRVMQVVQSSHHAVVLCCGRAFVESNNSCEV